MSHTYHIGQNLCQATKTCSSSRKLFPSSTKKKGAKIFLKIFKEQWKPNARVNARPQVTRVTCVYCPPQFRARVFEWLYLSELSSEIIYNKCFVFKSLLSIRGYIQNLFLTCTREVGDPILSQNIDLKYVDPKAKQKEKKMQMNTWRCFKNHGIVLFGLMCRQKSHMAHQCSDHHSRERAYLNSCISL